MNAKDKYLIDALMSNLDRQVNGEKTLRQTIVEHFSSKQEESEEKVVEESPG